MVLKRGYHSLRYDPDFTAGKKVTKGEHKDNNGKLKMEA